MAARSTALAALAALATASLASPTKRQAVDVPQFVLDYAPLVYIDTQDPYFPSDLQAQLDHTQPEVNFTVVEGAPNPLTLNNLDQLNNLGGNSIYLTSRDDVTTNPTWLNGVKPDASGKTEGATSAAIIINDKGNGTIDAFFMYFYAYNEGDTVLGNELGDHIGDWEHNMVRFVNGIPTYVWYSQHANGAAYTYNAVEKDTNTGKRPIDYSGRGTHANYATAGSHDHAITDSVDALPLLQDYTSKGPLWDPTLSAYYYSVSFAGAADGDSSSPTFTALQDPTNANAPLPPVNWLYFVGQWGDQQYPDSDSRQHEFFGFYKYTGGPTGPRDKQLNRADVCPDNGDKCIHRTFLTPGS